MKYKGILKIDNKGCLKCGNYYLKESIENDFKKGSKVFIKYYLSAKDLSLEQAKTAIALKLILGDIEELEFILFFYKDLIIGRLGLIEELKEYEGRYLILIIEKT